MKKIVLIGLIGLTIFLLGCTTSVETACTSEARICPDGSAVGREGPNCEFAPCPDIGEGVGIHVSELVSNSEKYLNQTIILKGKESLLRCTKKACIPEQTCCNSCSGEISDLYASNISITATGMDCAFGKNRYKGRLVEDSAIDYVFVLETPYDTPINIGEEWFSIQPIQCSGNPWDKYDSIDFEEEVPDWSMMENWLMEDHGIEMLEFTSKQPEPGTAFCDACDCPRGDTIALLVDSSYKEKMLELGFEKMFPIDCTEDARVCDDGTVVVREAPFCEFPECDDESVIPEEPKLFIMKKNVPGFVPTEFYEFAVTEIYEDGKVTIETTNGIGDDATVSFEQKQLTNAQIQGLKDFILTTNFFNLSEEDTRTCVIDAPTKELKISIDDQTNEINEIGSQCNQEIMTETLEIIKKIEELAE